MSGSSTQDILGHRLFDGKIQSIYSIIDQPNLVCIHQKDTHDSSSSLIHTPTTRRGSLDGNFRLSCLQQRTRSNTESEINSKSILITSITTCVYEILREAAIPTFYVALHPQADMFIAKRCMMIPILWTIRRFADETYVKRNPGVAVGHRFVPPMIEVYYKRQSIDSRRAILINSDETFEIDRDNSIDEEEFIVEEYISSICSYEQLLNTHIHIENIKISPTDLEYMYEICCTVFDILEHVWMAEKNCRLVDLKLEFGITTTATKEIVVANVYDTNTWHILRPTDKITSLAENLTGDHLIWINHALRDILDLTVHISSKLKTIVADNNHERQESSAIPEEGPSAYEKVTMPLTTSRCVVVCSSSSDIEHAQQIKTTLYEFYNIQCDIRLLSIYKSSQTLSKFLSHYSYEHRQPTVFITLGNLNNGLAISLSSNSQHPIIHCLHTDAEQTNNLIDVHSFISNDTPLFTVVLTLSSAIQNVIRIFAMNDWRLWTKQRGQRFKRYMDLILADQQLIKTQTVKLNNAVLMNLGTH